MKANSLEIPSIVGEHVVRERQCLLVARAERFIGRSSFTLHAVPFLSFDQLDELGIGQVRAATLVFQDIKETR